VGVTAGGSCFGFSVRSSLELAYLRAGGGHELAIEIDDPAPPPDEDALLVAWTPRPEAPTIDARLYADGDRYRMWIAGDGGGWFSVDPAAPRIGVPAVDDAVRREERLWGVPAALCFLARGELSLHAAAVEVGGAAIVLAAPSRFGKTTLAAAFTAAGHRLLTEDLCCLRPGTPFDLIPGPAMLRPRHDVAAGLGLDPSWIVSQDAERVHLALPPAHRGTCDPVPLGAVIFLRESDDGIHLTRVSPADALADLWALSLRLPGREDSARLFDAIVSLADSVPVWDLARPVRLDALVPAVDRVVANA
jgi:hypothetical protein